MVELSLGDYLGGCLIQRQEFSRDSIRVGYRAIFSPTSVAVQERLLFSTNEEQRISSVDIVRQPIFTDEFNSLGENHLRHGKNHRGRCRAGVMRG